MASFEEIGRIARGEPGGTAHACIAAVAERSRRGGLPVPCSTALVTSSLVDRGDAGAAMPFSSFHHRGHGLTAGQQLLRDSNLTVGCTVFRVTSRLAVTRKALLISLEAAGRSRSTHTHLASSVWLVSDQSGLPSKQGRSRMLVASAMTLGSVRSPHQRQRVLPRQE